MGSRFAETDCNDSGSGVVRLVSYMDSTPLMTTFAYDLQVTIMELTKTNRCLNDTKEVESSGDTLIIPLEIQAMQSLIVNKASFP